MKIINASDILEYFFSNEISDETEKSVNESVANIISRVRKEGFSALREFSLKFDGVIPASFEVELKTAKDALLELKKNDAALFSALNFCADNIRAFAELQKSQVYPFEKEIAPGIFAGQNIIPVERAAVYVPRGRYPLVSSVLMGLIPAKTAGVVETFVVSAPSPDGLPDRRVLAAAALAGADRIFAIGGAHAIAAFAYGIDADEAQNGIPRADVIAGPGNKYVACAKRQIYGDAGIDTTAGPTDVLVIADETATPGLVAADLIAQAEHDVDARARAMVPSVKFAEKVASEVEARLKNLPSKDTAVASLEQGLLIVYSARDEAVAAANFIAPEHLELQTADDREWLPLLKNYGSIFLGEAAAEALGDYSAGINHTLPTRGAARFSGGLSVRNFLKVVTSLRVEKNAASAPYLEAAAVLARAEGLFGHEAAAMSRQTRV